MVHRAQRTTGDTGMLVCVDGLQQPPGTSVACDVDGTTNGICVFKLPLRARRHRRRVRIRVGQTRQIRLPRKWFASPLMLTCGSSAAVTDVITCRDGSLNAATVGHVDAAVCDYDRACDGTCTFAFTCPLCSYDALTPCLRPCFTCPARVNARVPVGHSQFVAFPSFTPAVPPSLLMMTCAASSTPGCRTTPTTLPPPPPLCLSDADCARYPEPCRTCVEGRCMQPPGTQRHLICPVLFGSTTTTLPPSVCDSDMDCRLEGGPVAGCQNVGMCSYCVR